MSANINTYIGRKPAWHELGTVTGKHMTWQEVAAEPGMSFDVVKRQLEWNGSRSFRIQTCDRSRCTLRPRCQRVIRVARKEKSQ